MLDRYLASKSVGPTTESDWRLAVRRFTETFGDRSILDIKKADARRLRDLLVQVPSRMPDKIREENVQRQIEWADQNDVARLSPGSVNKSLTALKSIWAWAYKETELFDDHPDVVNPFASISVADNRTQEEKRVPPTAEEMNLIFGPEFQEPSGADRWIPLIALYSGAVLEEIGQLETADVRQDGARTARCGTSP